jgi:hypothetical protein
MASGIAVGALLLHGAAFGLVIPALESVWVVPRVVAAVQRSAAARSHNSPPPGCTSRASFSSLALRRRSSPAQMPRISCEARGVGLPLSSGTTSRNSSPQAAAAGQQPVLRERVTGLAIGRVRRVDIGVYTAAR